MDFLIAYAPLILCHSLFKVVIDDIAEGRELIVALGTVYTIIHRNKVNIMFWKHDLRIHADLQIITSETRHILNDNTLDKTCLNISTQELNKYFGQEVTPQQMKAQIVALLDEWKEKQPPEKKAELEK